MHVIIGLLLRHVLTGVGAVMVSKGITDPTGAEAIVGALVTLGGVALSAFQKWKSGALAK